MELKRRVHLRKFVTIFYVAAFSAYMILGLKPVEARQYEISGELTIPSIGLVSDVTALRLENRRLDTPDTIVGSYSEDISKVLLIGHSSTVFENLHNLKLEELIEYNDNVYQVVKTETLPKAKINMSNLLSPTDRQTLVIMTCAGNPVGEKDATHRLIVTAVKI